MILKALYDYYHRCDDLAPMGMEYKEIAFLIVIDKEGNFVRLEDCRGDAKGRPYEVVKGKNSTSDISADFLYGKLPYVLGVSDANNVKERDKSCLKAFITVIEDTLKYLSNCYELIAMRKFYEKHNFLENIKADHKWSDLSNNPSAIISFMIDGELEIIASKSYITSAYLNYINQTESCKVGVCLVNGKNAKLANGYSFIGFPKSPNAKLVSFQKDSGYDSYGKKKSSNAPISKEAEFCYSTALKYLMSKNSRNNFMVEDRMFVFWASSIQKNDADDVQKAFYNLFGYSNDDDDDPNQGIELVKETFMSIFSGKRPDITEDVFYILGLYANKGRLAVAYWQELNLKIFARNILLYLDDFDIVCNNRRLRLGIYQIIWAVSRIDSKKGTISESCPNLPEAIMKSIIQGIPYPFSLMLACMNRIRAEEKEDEKNKSRFLNRDMYRAAIIKAYLNRINDNKNKKLTIMLDKENNNQGYLCGRLFATLEYAQERSSNGNSNIRERYMNAASATPAAVFPTLINLSVHHVDKLDKGGQVFFEKTKAEIMANISSVGFPTHLDIQDQGRFMVGYYHQRQEFYTSKENKEQTNKE